MQMLRKIKRVQPIIRIKQARVDEEMAVLEAIRRQKIDVVQAMKDSQRRYMAGIETLNQARTSRMRTNLETLESGIDHVKTQWYKLYQSVQDLERKEKAQIAQLLTAERELRSIEKLQERYQIELRRELAGAEQKNANDIAIGRYNAGRQG
jgi:hypothetical protein